MRSSSSQLSAWYGMAGSHGCGMLAGSRSKGSLVVFFCRRFVSGLRSRVAEKLVLGNVDLFVKISFRK